MVGEWRWGRCGVVGVGRLGWGVFLSVGGGGVGGESTSFSIDSRLDSLLVDGQGKARQPKEGARLVVSFSSQAAHVWVCAANRGCMFSRVEFDRWHECGVCAVHTARATCENERARSATTHSARERAVADSCGYTRPSVLPDTTMDKHARACALPNKIREQNTFFSFLLLLLFC